MSWTRKMSSTKMTKISKKREDPAANANDPTAEVGSEGGTHGEVEIGADETGTGSEATETWRPADREVTEVARDETGQGKRSP